MEKIQKYLKIIAICESIRLAVSFVCFFIDVMADDDCLECEECCGECEKMHLV